MQDYGLGKGKPYASKIARKRMGYGSGGYVYGGVGRPKGFGKGSSSVLAGKYGSAGYFHHKRRRSFDFGQRKRANAKTKMRGIFGVPGLGLQRPSGNPTSFSTSNTNASQANASDDEPGGENKLVLVSAKDKFVLTQDVCVMCGALGTDQEGCLIACAQCGQCYHPYCVNVKVYQ